DPVAAVDRDLHRPRDPDIADDAIDVCRNDVRAADLPRAVIDIAEFDAGLDALDLGLSERRAGNHHLEAVVIGRIVAAGDHDATLGAEVLRGEVAHRGGDHANV